MQLTLKRSDGRILKEKFARDGVLFLVSTETGPKLVDNLQSSENAYFVFVERFFKVLACQISHVGFTFGGHSKRSVKDGDEITIGIEKFKVNIKGLLLRKYMMCVVPVLVACLLSGLMFFACLEFSNFRNSSAANLPQLNKKSNDKKVDDLIIEARNYLKSGLQEQAKLALLSAKDIDPNDQRLYRLISEIDEGGAVQSDANAKSSNGLKMDEIVNQIKSLRQSGDVYAALMKAKETLGLYGSSDDSNMRASIASLHEGLFNEAKSMADAECDKMRSEISHTSDSQISDMVKSLVSKKNRLGILEKAVSDDEKIKEFSENLSLKLDQASKRWMDIALATESISGCKKALPIFEEIGRVLADSSPDISKDAVEAVVRCGKIGLNK